ncbi:nucleolar protein 12 [Chelonus insularis]|uniref:nucleolar protein 12 n=1 Tax=Chelonus insularis TaxID=460826 RepID=UPI0015894C08|nr:nucleolar protein 12 [Chelonus insularis]
MALVSRQFPNLNRNVNRKSNNRRKVHLIFDEKERKEYLTGFSKRKQERRRKANEKLKLKIKEEKKRIKREVKNEYLPISHRDIPEVEKLLSQKEYETEGKTVSILELNLNDLTRSSSWIGDNVLTHDENLENDDADTLFTSNCHDDKVILSKKELSSAIKKTYNQKILSSKVFQRKQSLERKKNKHKFQGKESLKQRALKKNNNKKKKKSTRKT